MNRSTLKTAALLAAGACLGSAPALALDGKVVLDQLVKKGVLTAEEADAIVKKDMEKTKADPVPATVVAKQSDASKVVFSGRVQVQGKYFSRDDKASGTDAGETPSSGFEMRRLNFDVDATLVEGFSLFGSIEVNAGNGGGNNASSTGYAVFIDRAGVALDTDAGRFMAALQKSKYALEEYTSSSSLYTVERGAISNYFANSLQLGGRHAGLYWETADNTKTGGPRFGAGIANAYQGAYSVVTTPSDERYAPAFYANADHVLVINDTTTWQNGVNLVYTEANINQLAGLPGTTNTNANFDTRTLGVEFISKLTAGRFTLLGDFMSAFIENGTYENLTGAKAATPWGATALVAYKLSDSFEPVLQFGYADSDGRGIGDNTFRDFANDGNGVSPGTGLASTTYDRAFTLFAGANWYITPKSLKLSAGLDCARFVGRPGNTAVNTKQEADCIGGRVQIQALF